MNLVKCSNGHFYDQSRYEKCPHCNASMARNDNLTVPVVHSPGNDAVTTDMSAMASATSNNVAPSSGSLQEAVKAATSNMGSQPSVQPMNDEVTVSFYKKAMGAEPVVGWLVCTSPSHFGQDFKLKSGRNFIGRSPAMDVAIINDATVSREKHAIVVYEPKNHVFMVAPGESKELCYLNDQVVLSAKELHLHDVLTVGETNLRFIPCCDSQFNWSSVKQGEVK